MLNELVNSVILNLSAIDENPRADQTLRDDLGFDSLKMVELLIALEEVFEIEIDESDLDPALLIQVHDIYALVGKYADLMVKI